MRSDAKNRNRPKSETYRGDGETRDSLVLPRAETTRAFERRQERFADKFNYISRSDDAISLKYRHQQEQLYNAIQAQELKSENDHQYVMSSYRKLREGVLAGGVYDEFAVQDHSLAALTQSKSHFYYSELLKSLAVLTNTLYPCIHRPCSRRAEMSKYYLLYLICSRSSMADVMLIYSQLPWNLRQHSNEDIGFAFGVLKCLMNVDYTRFAILWKVASGCDRIFLELALPLYRSDVLKVFTRSFFTYPLSLLHHYLLYPQESETIDFLTSHNLTLQLANNDQVVVFKTR